MESLIIVAVIVVALLLAVGIPLSMWLGRRGRGTLRLELPGDIHRAGDEIRGTIHLEAGKELGPGTVVASLVCTERWWERDDDGDGNQTRRERKKEVYRHDIDVAEDLSMLAGERRPIPFSLPTPPPTPPSTAADQPSGFRQFMTSLAEIGRSGREQMWEVRARYDIRGLDLVGERRIDLVEHR
jgi:hypothetical protein